MNAKFIRQTFPRVRLAVQSNYLRQQPGRGVPAYDLIFAVESNTDWHKENFAKNKGHYTIIPRYTFKHRVVSFFVQYGAKIHFNSFKNQAGESLRYGVIEMEDLKNDLLHWETLVCSSKFQKPIDILISDHQFSKWQTQNLKSAFAFGALTTPEGSREAQFYQNIAGIPTQKNTLFRLLDKQDPSQIVEQNMAVFKEKYQNIQKQAFNEIVEFDSEGRFRYLKGREEVQAIMMRELNHNLLRSLVQISTSLSKEEKEQLLKSGINEIQAKLLPPDNETLKQGVGKILRRHQLTRIFQLLMGKMFFIFMMGVKYSAMGIMFLVLYLFFTKKEAKGEEIKGEEVQAS